MPLILGSEVHRIKADVAIIGGGTAGLNSALAAAEMGADVLVVDKTHIQRSGAIAGGIDHFFAYFDSGPAWDTRDAYLAYVSRVARGAANIRIHEKVYCDELTAAMERIERMGVSLQQPDGTFLRTQALGQPGPIAINFDGKLLKPKMAFAVKKKHIRVINRVQVSNIYLHDGVHGLCRLRHPQRRFLRDPVQAVVIATGNTNRMFRNQTGNPFNLWYCPANTGDLHRAAFHAGVELANVEYIRLTIVPKGFSAPGFNAFFGMGGKFVNGLGQEFMQNYHPMCDKAPRNMMVWGAQKEVRAGRGPIYVDVRHLSARDLAHLFLQLGIDKDTLPEFLKAKGYDREGALIELTVSEPMQARPSELCGSGIKIDETCASNVPGLFAAGDASDQMGCLHMCMAGGYAAGRHSARYAAGVGHHAPLPAKAPEDERARVFAPLLRKDGMASGEFENIVRIIATDHFGPYKSEISLTSAIAKLNGLDRFRDDLKANNLHELMRCHEAMNIQSVARIVAHAALARKESRFVPYHYAIERAQLAAVALALVDHRRFSTAMLGI